MDFLTNAFYSADAEQPERLCGVLLTSFEPKDIASRAHQRYLTLDELRTSKSVRPAGFMLSNDGVLLSDSAARRVLDTDLSQYLVSELKGDFVFKEKSLIDFVLLGAECGCLASTVNDVACAHPVSFSNLRVSNSSFNIYGAYQNEDGSFRTLSLVDVDNITSLPFTAAIPVEHIERFEEFRKWMTPVSAASADYLVYRVDVPLRGYGAFTGEAFCNYLAYNVSYFTIGLKTIQAYLGDNAPQYKAMKTEDAPERKYRTDPPNLSIVAPYKDTKLHRILDKINDQEQIAYLLQEDMEAAITMSWLQTIFKQEQCGEDSIELCLNLQLDCRLLRLHCACELLAQRLYLHGLGIFDDTLGPVLKGGGVNGNSFKKFTR